MKTNTMGGTRPRNEGDAYYTPDALALAITTALRDRLDLTPGFVIEPNAGAGAFVRAVGRTWPGIREFDAVEPNREAWPPEPQGADWHPVTWEAWARDNMNPHDRVHAKRLPVLILGNPPYNLPGDGKGDAPTTAERHVTLALDRLPPGGHVAFLLRLAFLSGGARTERLHSRGLLRALWPVTPRPSFTGGGTDGSEYGVFVWRNGSRSTSVDMQPLVWNAPKRGRRAS